VVTVFMGHDDCGDPVRAIVESLQPPGELYAAKPGVHEQGRVTSLYDD